jgi:hypothetical protein
MKIERDSLKPIDFEGLEIRDYTAGTDVSSSVAETTVPAGVGHRLAWSKRFLRMNPARNQGTSYACQLQDAPLADFEFYVRNAPTTSSQRTLGFVGGAEYDLSLVVYLEG